VSNIRWQLGRFAELLPLLRVTATDDDIGASILLARALACTTETKAEATEVVRKAASHEFDDLPRGLHWTGCLVAAAEVAYLLDDALLGRLVRDLLEPFADGVAFTKLGDRADCVRRRDWRRGSRRTDGRRALRARDRGVSPAGCATVEGPDRDGLESCAHRARRRPHEGVVARERRPGDVRRASARNVRRFKPTHSPVIRPRRAGFAFGCHSLTSFGIAVPIRTFNFARAVGRELAVGHRRIDLLVRGGHERVDDLLGLHAVLGGDRGDRLSGHELLAEVSALDADRVGDERAAWRRILRRSAAAWSAFFGRRRRWRRRRLGGVPVEAAPATDTPVSPRTAATLADAMVLVNLMGSPSPRIVMGP